MAGDKGEHEPTADDAVLEMAATLRRRVGEDRQRRDHRRRGRLAKVGAELDRLCAAMRTADPDLRRIVLFGSLARQEAPRNPDFDIDLAVETSDLARLEAVVESSDFHVDLVDLSTASDFVRRAVAEDGRVLYDRTRNQA